MSYYLSLGITTRLTIQKEQVLKSFQDLDFVVNYVQTNFNSTNLYDVKEDDTKIEWTLKRDIFDDEIVDFSKDFFKYLPDIHEFYGKEYKTIMLDILSTVENAQQLFNQVNKLMEQDYFPYLRFIELDEYIYKSQEENYDAPTEFFEILSMGKCLETFFFPFFEKLIKEKFQQYRISSVIMLNRL